MKTTTITAADLTLYSRNSASGVLYAAYATTLDTVRPFIAYVPNTDNNNAGWAHELAYYDNAADAATHSTFARSSADALAKCLALVGTAKRSELKGDNFADFQMSFPGVDKSFGTPTVAVKAPKVVEVALTADEQMYKTAIDTINSSDDEEGCAIETSVGIRYIDRSEQLGFTLAEMREFILGAA